MIALTFKHEDAAERVKRYILKTGNNAVRNGSTVTTDENGYYKYAYANLYKGLPNYTSKSKAHRTNES